MPQIFKKTDILTMKRYYLLLIAGLVAICMNAEVAVSGKVIDAENGEPLPFVNVYFVENDKPTSTGTTTDYDGNFHIHSTQNYRLLHITMMGYKTEEVRLTPGKTVKNLKVALKPDAYVLNDVVVTQKREKRQYKRKNNPAVELIKKVIAHKDSLVPQNADHFKAETYYRQSFALENFTPNYEKWPWKHFTFFQNYLDTTGGKSSLTLSLRENLGHEVYQRSPRKEKSKTDYKRFYGVEAFFSTPSLEHHLRSIFTDVDIYDNNMDLLFNRFVSPLSSLLAVSYYQYYIMDTLWVDGSECIDLAFVPVNSESYSFTGHLYILNDGSYKLKRYTMNVPPNINLNFVSNYRVECTYNQLDNGIWVPERTLTTCNFYLTNKKRTLLARQTKLYTGYDFETPIDPSEFSYAASRSKTAPAASDSASQALAEQSKQSTQLKEPTVEKPKNLTSELKFQQEEDDMTFAEEVRFWDANRPEPLSPYEMSMVDLIEEFKNTPKFNSLIMAIDAIASEYVSTVPSTRWGESKWDFGPLYNFVSWNPLEGVRLRLGGQTTANLHPHWFFSTYAAFGTCDLRPKGEAKIIYSFNKKMYHPYEPLRNYLMLSTSYDVDEPAQQFGVVDRDHILMSIPTGKVVMKNYQYVARAKLMYFKEFPFQLTTKAWLQFDNNEAAGAMQYNRIDSYDDAGAISLTTRVKHYNDYQLGVELRYSPGADFPINRQGVETPFTLEQDAPVFSIIHNFGYLDDRYSGGKGFFYNTTQLTAEKRFWFSSFGHLDVRLQAGAVWNKVPFMKLYTPTTSSSIFLGKNAFNLMQPMEFMMDGYVSLYTTYFFKGWILNRIPGINKLGLRGVVSFSAIYGGLTDRNNPYVAGGEGLYRLPDSSRFTDDGQFVSGYTSSPIGKWPYMELTVGLENIFKFIRIDYVRRLNYNDYLLPNGMHRKVGAWGRNGVKLTIRFAL